MHKWKYRNPADRTCELCGQNEQQWVMAYEGTNWMRPGAGWWEVVKPSNTACAGRFAAWFRGVQRLFGSRQ